MQLPGSFFRFRFACFLIAWITALPALPQKVDTLIFNGPSVNRVDITQMGDGWTSATQSPAMIQDLDSHIKNMFTVATYQRYAKFFNVFRVEHFRSGPPAGVGWESKANMDYYINYLTKAVPASEIRYVVSREGKGHSLMGDGNNTGNAKDRVFAAPTLDPDMVGMHLMGHAWHALGDTYDNAGSGADYWPNKANDPDSKKWERWLGFVEPYNGWKIGVYPIRGTTNAYREFATSNSIMADIWLYATMRIVHTPVEREKIVHDIYSLVNPMDSHTPNGTVLKNPSPLAVKVIDPSVIQVDWYLDGKLVGQDRGETFNILAHVSSPGRYSVRAHAFDRVINHAFSDRNGGMPDSLDWVRNENKDLQQEVTWTLDITTTAVLEERKKTGLSFGAVTASSIEFGLRNAGNYVVDLVSPQGRILKPLASGFSSLDKVLIRWDGDRYPNQLLWIRLSHNGQTAWHKWIGAR